MKPLSVAILSDLHLDMHFKAFRQTKADVRTFFDPIFMPDGKEPADVLIVAGDLGHYNSENLGIIGYLKELYFKHIVCILGNHDYYLIDNGAIKEYDWDPFARIEEMRRMLNGIDGIYCLNGDIVTIEGIRFGGCDSFYDAQYLFKTLYPDIPFSICRARELWRCTMNDAIYIKGKCFDEIWEIERAKIEAVYQQCDVMITHVSPSINPEHIPESDFRKDDATAFFTFDGEQYVKETTAKIWIYGHTHTPNDYQWHGVRLIANPLGYPGEVKNVQEKRIEIDPIKEN